ncbi:dihydrofolate reductase family protein [Emticicia sp. BO119]|uniref:dihydrofolate reductase family protein n=1 Tax=Emticicia sp. BO119 TaxID=2757768 RepID=UPI0015F0F9AE|nr:dihydrofolate reductase family protein [Emticicia sp. BO119]MBA4850621.1 dihydrofolate reductase family protein [Emticicia sp. BO119]
MRKLIYGINLTLDGCCDHTKGNGSEEIHEYFTDLLRQTDLIIYGRITYELMVPFWPDVAKTRSMNEIGNEFARVFDSIEKLVFSRTLDSVEDKNSRIARADLYDEIVRLKNEPGRDISLGGVNLPSQLIEMGLVDEFHFVYQPVIVGEGRRLFDHTNLPEKLDLKLVESKIFKSGGVALHYIKQ